MTDDRELWERILRGDAHAFDGFYQQNYSSLFRFIRQLLGSESAAQDVAQDIFLRLWQGPNGFQPAKGSLRAYLFGIARNRCAEWWRQWRGPGSTGVAPSADPAYEADADQSALVAQALSRLEPDKRALLWLREVEGQSYGELAGILKIPIGTVKSRLFAAREELRRIWSGIGTQEREKP